MKRNLLYILIFGLLAGATFSCTEEDEPPRTEENDTIAQDTAIVEATDGFGFSSLRNWTGEGENEAALAIQWVAPDAEDLENPSDEEVLFLAWGYRWQAEEEKFGIDMLRDIASADQRLFVLVSESGLGPIVVGLGYDGNGDGKILVRNPANENGIELRETDFANGTHTLADASAADGLQAASEGDWWTSGWNEAYASYWNHEGDTITPTTEFEYAPLGVGMRPLSNHSWDAWTFSSVNSAATNTAPITKLLQAAD